MSVDNFLECARESGVNQFEAWDEMVITPLVEFAEWFKEQSSVVQEFLEAVLGRAGNAAIAAIAAVVGASAAEVIAAIVGGFSAGVGIGATLIIIAECADQL